jgi:ABC-2 type transport system permease protein
VTAIPSVAPRAEGSARALLDFYLARMRMAVQSEFQYRVGTYFYMVGMVAEPVIYLVVWTTIAEQSGGSVNGLTPGYLAAYYITWTLVRNMNVVYGAPFWEYRIREGRLSGDLLKPIHPLHQDLAHFAGAKVIWILLWLPIAAALTLLFDPELHPRPAEIAVFAVAIWGAYLLRTMFQSTLGMLCFWTTRGAAVFDLWMMTELLLSGRLVPLPLMPDWVQELARFLPFQWAFFFPIESLVGDMSNEELLRGLGAQLLWILIGFVLFRVAWHHAIKRFSAVGS